MTTTSIAERTLQWFDFADTEALRRPAEAADIYCVLIPKNDGEWDIVHAANRLANKLHDEIGGEG